MKIKIDGYPITIVQSDSGRDYSVNLEKMECSCPDYQYRGRYGSSKYGSICKHIKFINDNKQNNNKENNFKEIETLIIKALEKQSLSVDEIFEIMEDADEIIFKVIDDLKYNGRVIEKNGVIKLLE